MRITCPSCSAAYDVPDSLVTAGRVAQCARCGGNWTPVQASVAPPEAPSEQPAPGSPEDEPTIAVEPPVAAVAVTPSRHAATERLAAPAARPQPSTRLRLAWAASVVSLVALAGAAYLMRGQIVAAWPPSAQAYATFGLHPQTEAPR
jgi:predicted Zn finger-like uncharacterized protein